MAANPKPKYTLEEYFDLELSTNERFEYFDGEIFSMSGVSEQHSQIEINFIASLSGKLRGRPCRVFRESRYQACLHIDTETCQRFAVKQFSRRLAALMC